MIIVVILLQIFILGWLFYITNEIITLKVQSGMTYEYVLGFLSRYCAENPDYGKSVFPDTWEKIQKERK